MRKKLFYIIAFIITFSVCGITALAAIDTSKPATLEIRYKYEDTAITGARFNLYRAASVSEDGKYSAAEGFEESAVNFTSIGADEGRQLASTLAIYAEQYGLAPTVSANTNSEGKVKFSPLETGLYLVTADKTVQGTYRYETEPFIITLPVLDSDTWNYSIIASPKAARKDKDDTSSDTVVVKVLKAWDDEGYESHRPQSIEVVLSGGGREDSVVLNEDNNWRYEWSDLAADVNWIVTEKNVPEGYTVTISKEGITFLITNKYEHHEPPTEHETSPGGNPGSKETTTQSVTEPADEPTTEKVPEPTTVKPGEPTTEKANEPTTEKADEPTTEKADEPTTEAPAPSEPTTAGPSPHRPSGGGGPPDDPTPEEETSDEPGVTEDSEEPTNEDATETPEDKEEPSKSEDEVPPDEVPPDEIPPDNSPGGGDPGSETPDDTPVYDPLTGTYKHEFEQPGRSLRNLWDFEKDPDGTQGDGNGNGSNNSNNNRYNNGNGTLPQTGMVRLPIPIMALCGIVLFLIGYIINRKS